jgi:class 3 adenylate cyclase
MPPTIINEAFLEAKLAQLEKARPWSPQAISRLETFIRNADDFEIFRVNPLHYARDKGLPEGEAIDLFLHATHIGLFELDWLLMCAYCPSIAQALHHLDKVHPHFVCRFCQAENDVALDDYIQVVFTLSPQVRDLKFFHPETLSTEDFYFRYAMAKGIMPPPGMTLEQILQMLTKALADLPPGAEQSFDLDLPPGRFEVSDLEHNALLVFMVEAKDGTEHPPTHIVAAPDGYHLASQTSQPLERRLGVANFKWDQVGALPAGKQQVTIKNEMTERARLWLLEYPPEMVAYYQPYEPFLTGNRLLTTQTFRDLFRSATIAADEGIAIRDITFVFTDLKGSTAMYEQIGDAKAYFLVRQHFDALARVITDHGGAIIKTIGDAVMAAFENPANATGAAIEMIDALARFNQTISQKLILKVGLHRGHSIAVTLNEHIDYFGQTVNIASRVQALADSNEVYLTAAVFDASGVDAVLQGHPVNSEFVQVKGVSEKLQVYKIGTKIP